MNRVLSSCCDGPVSDTDITRFIVIAGLSVTIAIMTVMVVPDNPASFIPLLFYIPILYAAFFYPRPGLYVAGACAVLYEIIGSVSAYPDPVAAVGVIGQGVLFVVIGALVTRLSEKIRTGEEVNRQLSEQILRDTERRRGVITTVAHELRTPLQPLMGYLNLLLQDPPYYGINEDTRKILARCLTSVERERTIINRMLEFSILESGKLRPDYSTFPVRDLIDSVVGAGGFSTQASIITEVPENLTFHADAGRIGIVIDSMLANALAYSRPPRRIRISYISPPGLDCHELAIEDNGIGIPADMLDTIFEPFQLADSANLSRKYDRIGLSLSIAQMYLRMHGGFISVRSVVNEGSTFTLHLPMKRKTEDSI